MIGQTVSHYRILEELGSGGMGVVYKAEDTKLKRTVALKFLPPELTRDKAAKTRFIHEAQAASALQHHNICTIHEIDETKDGRLFIVMDCYDGETLKEKIAKGPLPVAEAVNIALQVAEGLVEAHRAGMIHRDLKPANIMVTRGGVAKILDFGLAKLAGQTKVTKTGTTVGTVAYMSPEQARGEEVDLRSDIWSLGIVLYEMLAGEAPFTGDHEVAVLYRIMNEEPKPATGVRTGVPIEIERIIGKCMAKELGKRYQTVEDLIADVRQVQGARGQSVVTRGGSGRARRWRWVFPLIVISIVAVVVLFQKHRPASVPEEKSIAVLPFVDISPQKDQEYFCDGITEELINRLSKLQTLRVPARTSAFYFKGKAEDIREVGERLNVQTVLEGSVRKSGDQLRITARLISVSDGYHLWSDTFDRKQEDVLVIQDEISSAIVSSIRAELTPTEAASLKSAAQVDAKVHEAYLWGRYHWNKRTRDGLEKSVNYYKSAIELDPTFAPGYAALAEAYMVMVTYGYGEPRELYAVAARSAEKAIDIDDKLSSAYAALAGVKMFFEFDYEGAERLYKKAIALDPNNSTAHQWYAEFLSYRGRHEEALSESDKALAIDPLSVIANSSKAVNLYRMRRYEEAIAQCRGILDLDNEFTGAHSLESKCFRALGKYREHVEEFQQSISRDEKGRRLADEAGRVFEQSGTNGFYRWQIEHIDEYSESSVPYMKVQLYALLGERDPAIEWMEKVIEMRAEQAQWWITDPALDNIRDDPGFRAVLRNAGLEA